MKQVIIVTGANGGIGRLACTRFTELGHKVIGLDINFDTSSTDYEKYVVDLTKEDEVKAVISKIIESHKIIDSVFNIAGGSGRSYGDGPLHECTIDGFEKTVELNLTTQFLMNKYVLEHMMNQNRGCIINVSSVLGMSGGGDNFATHTYAASKAAIIGMSRAMASYYAKYNIRVNVIAPGLIETPMSQRAQTNDVIIELMRRKQPIYMHEESPLGKPKSVVKAAEFLISDEADFVTGIVLPVDGGWTM